MGFFERFANFVPTPFFKLEQGFSRVHGHLGAFVPIVPVFNKSSIYKYIYRDSFLYSFFPRFRFENNWNKWNIHWERPSLREKVRSNSDFANWNNWNKWNIFRKKPS